MNVLAIIGPGGARELAQLWAIAKINYAAMINGLDAEAVPDQQLPNNSPYDAEKMGKFR